MLLSASQDFKNSRFSFRVVEVNLSEQRRLIGMSPLETVLEVVETSFMLSLVGRDNTLTAHPY